VLGKLENYKKCHHSCSHRSNKRRGKVLTEERGKTRKENVIKMICGDNVVVGVAEIEA
jgi:hypothetical protein